MQTFMPNHVKVGENVLPKSPTPTEKEDGMMLIF